MAYKNARQEPSWQDVLAWIQRIEEEHNVTITTMQCLRPTGRAEAFKAAVVVSAQARDGAGTGGTRLARTGTWPTVAQRSMTGLLLNLLHQLDNGLCWQEADAARQEPLTSALGS